MELIGKKFIRKDQTLVESLLGSTTIYTIEESKKKGILIIRWNQDGESVHNTYTIKKATENIKTGKWIIQK